MERTRPQSTNNTDSYSQDEAELIWSEAAKLQSQAQDRLEERSKAISSRFEESNPSEYSGFDKSEIRMIAEEAGISSEFVDMAFLKAKATPLSKGESVEKSLSEKLLRLEEHEVEESMTFDMPLEKVYEAMKRVFPSSKYDLELSDVIGDGTPGDTVLGFKVPKMMNAAGAVNPFSQQMTYSDVKRIYATIHPISDRQCQVTLRGETAHKKTSNTYLILSLIFAFFVAFFTFPVGIAGLDLSFLQILPVFTLVYALSAAGFFSASRAMHRWGGKKTGKALEELLQAVKVDALTEGSFSSTTPSEPVKDLFG